MSPASGSPLALFFVPDHPGGKVLIEQVMISSTLRIRLEPFSECGSLVCTSIHHILHVANSIRVESDRLVIGEANLKAHNGGVMLLHGKHIETPMSFTAANIARIKILLDLIAASAKLHGDPIMALVHILVDVLDGLDRWNGLHIDVAPILPDQVLGVTHHLINGPLAPSQPQ
jgi:hypothetical protein